MTLSRRLFLGAALAAPAIVRAESLMKLWVPQQRILAVDPFGTRGVIEAPWWQNMTIVDEGGDRPVVVDGKVFVLEVHHNGRRILATDQRVWDAGPAPASKTWRPMAFPREWA